MTNRRDFLKASAAIAAVSGARAAFGQPAGVTYLPPPSSDQTIDYLTLEALNAAHAAGHTYADDALGREPREFGGTAGHNVSGDAGRGRGEYGGRRARRSPRARGSWQA